jgi:hypothetical protein
MAGFDASGLYKMLTYFGTNLENSKLNIFLESKEENSSKAVVPFFTKT